MKTIERRPGIQPLAWFLCLALGFTSVGWLSQRAMAAEEQESLALVGIENISGYGAQMLAQQATDALRLALLNKGPYRLIPPARIEEVLRLQAYETPLTDTELALLGQDLGADLVLAGQLRAVTIKSHPREAIVKLEVRLIDVELREVVGRSTRSASSGQWYDYKGKEQVLVEEALGAAAEAVATALVGNAAMKGVVLSYQGEEVVVSLSHRDGLRPGAELAVTRDGQIVARLRTVEVHSADSRARLMFQAAGAAVRTNDPVRVVSNPAFTPFDEEEIAAAEAASEEAAAIPGGQEEETKAPPSSKRQKSKSKWTQALLGLAVVGILYWLNERGKKGSSSRLLSPSDRSNILVDDAGNLRNPVQFIWTAVTDVQSYVLEISGPNDPQFTQSLYSRAVSSNTVDFPSELLLRLENQATYYWRVKVITKDRVFQLGPYQFTVQVVPSGQAIRLIAPQDGIGYRLYFDEETKLFLNPPLFTWQAVSGATEYLLTLATDPEFRNIVLTQEVTSSAVSPEPKLYTPSGGTYFWKVETGLGLSSDTVNPWRVTIIQVDPPAALNLRNLDTGQLLPPIGAQVNTDRIEFIWSGVDGSVPPAPARGRQAPPAYQVEVAADPDFQDVIWPRSETDVTSITTNTSLTYAGPPLEVRAPLYYWRVGALESGVATPIWGRAGSFQRIAGGGPPASGSRQVTSTPSGAAIWLDGSDTGQVTPATLTGITAGTHPLLLRLAGYQDYTTSVTAVAGQTATVSATLIPVGAVFLDSRPVAARIFLDGEDTGHLTPYTLQNVPAGTHLIRLERENCNAAEFQVDVTAGQLSIPDLAELTCSGNYLSINSNPQGAAIWLNGVDTGEVTPHALALEPGLYSVCLELTGYLTYRNEAVTVTAGETTSIDVTLPQIPPGGQGDGGCAG